jgi:RHS repeat-associated protein
MEMLSKSQTTTRTALNVSSGAFEEQRKFAGTEYDTSTGLNQMGARYYAGGKGRFLSEDPAFLELGGPSFGKKVSEASLRAMGNLLDTSARKNPNEKLLEMYLSNPQLLNSYSYVVNNPLKYKDEDGNTPLLLAIAGVGYGVGQQYFEDRHNIQNGFQNGYSSAGEYLVSAGTGVAVAFTSKASLPLAAGLSFAGSGIEDIVGKKPSVDFTKATVDAGGTLLIGGAVLRQLPGSIADLPKIAQFTVESTKTFVRSVTAELSIGNAVAALAVQVKDIQRRIENLKNGKK